MDVKHDIRHYYDVSTSQLRDVELKVRIETSPNRYQMVSFSVSEQNRTEHPPCYIEVCCELVAGVRRYVPITGDN